jgi:hypothetical protein
MKGEEVLRAGLEKAAYDVQRIPLLPRVRDDDLSRLADRIATMNLRDRRKFANERMGAPVLPTVQAVSRTLSTKPREVLLGRINLRLIATGRGPKHRP